MNSEAGKFCFRDICSNRHVYIKNEIRDSGRLQGQVPSADCIITSEQESKNKDNIPIYAFSDGEKGAEDSSYSYHSTIKRTDLCHCAVAHPKNWLLSSYPSS